MAGGNLPGTSQILNTPPVTFPRTDVRIDWTMFALEGHQFAGVKGDPPLTSIDFSTLLIATYVSRSWYASSYLVEWTICRPISARHLYLIKIGQVSLLTGNILRRTGPYSYVWGTTILGLSDLGLKIVVWLFHWGLLVKMYIHINYCTTRGSAIGADFWFNFNGIHPVLGTPEFCAPFDTSKG